MPTGQETWFDNDAKAVHVDLLYTVAAKQVALVDGWLGVTVESGDSGDEIALTVDNRGYQFTVPSTLDVAKGDIVYIDSAQVTGHTPDDAGYATAADTGLIPLFKAQSDKDANNVVYGRLLSGLAY